MLDYEERTKLINEIGQDAKGIIKSVGNDYAKMNEYKMKVGDSMISNYIPTPFDIAKYYGIRIKYIEMDDGIVSYLKRETLTIYISDEYEYRDEDKNKNKKYIVGHLVAHELGHFFSDQDKWAAMSSDSFNKIYPRKIIKEYKANIYALFFEPRMLAGTPWNEYSVNELNEKIYSKVFSN